MRDGFENRQMMFALCGVNTLWCSYTIGNESVPNRGRDKMRVALEVTILVSVWEDKDAQQQLNGATRKKAYCKRTNFHGHNNSWVKFSMGLIFVGKSSPP